MTESGGTEIPPFIGLLAQISRASGHELRNALNAVVVNLEVVRARGGGETAQPFLDQSVAQSEESVRLAESLVGLVELILGAIGPEGMKAEFVAPRGVRFPGSPEEIQRAARALEVLAARGVLTVSISESAVILTAPPATASAPPE